MKNHKITYILKLKYTLLRNFVIEKQHKWLHSPKPWLFWERMLREWIIKNVIKKLLSCIIKVVYPIQENCTNFTELGLGQYFVKQKKKKT